MIDITVKRRMMMNRDKPLRLLIGGSPCTYWSIAQKSDNREIKAEGIGWELFKNYLIAKDKFQPDYFLYENNKSASQSIKDQISKELGVELQYINSALVSGQNRQRFYAHNIPNVNEPLDRGIILADILDSKNFLPFGTNNEGKSYCLDANYYKGSTPKQTLVKKRRTMVAELSDDKEDIYKIKDGYIYDGADHIKVNLPDGNYKIRKLTPIERERLQTLPDNYTEGVSNTQRYKCIGNGWTAGVIIHILSHIDYPKDAPIEVLSMYDGIATGRYCLEKLGYINITYKAYEIDKYAITIATKNYPDIIECGDAFQVRNEDWRF